MIYDILSPGDRTPSLLKASPKGEGFQPSPSGTLIEDDRMLTSVLTGEAVATPNQDIPDVNEVRDKRASIYRMRRIPFDFLEPGLLRPAPAPSR